MHLHCSTKGWSAPRVSTPVRSTFIFVSSSTRAARQLCRAPSLSRSRCRFNVCFPLWFHSWHRTLTRLNDPRLLALPTPFCLPSRVVLRRLLSPPQPKATKSGSAKKPAAAPYSKGKATKAPKNPLFEKRPRNFGIGK